MLTKPQEGVFHPQAAGISEPKSSNQTKKGKQSKEKRERQKRHLTKSCEELVHNTIKDKSTNQDDKSYQILTSGYRILSDICSILRANCILCKMQ